MKIYEDLHSDFYDNIVFSGGSSMFKGLPERFDKEIIKIAPLITKVNVVAILEGKYVV